MSNQIISLRLAWALFMLPALCATANESGLTDKQLVGALEHGGYVILMRHANSPRTPPNAAQMDPENSNGERQLDEAGRRSAQAMGEAFRRLRIPVGEVLSSPTYRALETSRLAQFPAPQTFAELGDAGKSMSSDQSGTRAAWLRLQVAQIPKPGTDTVIITHYPNIMEAFPAVAKDLAEGEALIFKPDALDDASLVGRVMIDEWPRLASHP